VMHPSAYLHANFWAGMPVPLWRQWGTGGLIVDWDLRTTLEGLYAAGGAVYGGGAHSGAAATGRYAGRKAAAYAQAAPEPAIDPAQVQRERARIYAPLAQHRRAIGWKELNAGICRIMQDYCGQFKNEETLRIGLRLLREIQESEAAMVHAANPHELARAVECMSIITVGEAVIHACLARKASSKLLNFHRFDYPEMDPPAWHKLLPVRQRAGEVQVDEWETDYFLCPPYAPTYKENYRQHCDR
jgi:succinate dehydrogenase/fumarate reductase flavoprotein subunit